MSEVSLDQKYELATQVICKQGIVPFPVNDTTISILKHVIEDNEEELDFIYVFRQKVSQTMEQLKKSSNLPEEKIEQLAASLAKKGMIFNQPSSPEQLQEWSPLPRPSLHGSWNARMLRSYPYRPVIMICGLIVRI